MKKIISAMFWKEFKIFLKGAFLMGLVYMFGIIFLVAKYLEGMNKAGIMDNDLVTIGYFICVIVTVSIVGSTTMVFSTAQDNKEGVLNSLLASVTRVSDVWLGQCLFYVLASCIMAFAGLVGLSIWIKTELLFTVSLDLKMILLCMIVAPAIGALYNAISLFFAWVNPYDILNVLPSMVLPFLLLYLLIKYVDKLGNWDVNVVSALLVGAVCMLLFWGLGKLINIVPKQNYVSKI